MWPLFWSITLLVLALQLILQFKILDQVSLLSRGDHATATAPVIFVIILGVAMLWFRLLRTLGQEMKRRNRIENSVLTICGLSAVAISGVSAVLDDRHVAAIGTSGRRRRCGLAAG